MFSKLRVTNTWHKFCDFPQPCCWHSFLIFQFFLQNPLNIAVQKATAHKLVLMPKFIYINASGTKPWVRSDAYQGFLIFSLKYIIWYTFFTLTMTSLQGSLWNVFTHKIGNTLILCGELQFIRADWMEKNWSQGWYIRESSYSLRFIALWLSLESKGEI